MKRFFRHDNEMRNRPELIALRINHGAKGYGVYCMILERLCAMNDDDQPVSYKNLAFDFRCSEGLVRTIIEDYDLFSPAEMNAFVTTVDNPDESSENADTPADYIRIARSEAGKKGMQMRWNNNKTITKTADFDNKTITKTDDFDNKTADFHNKTRETENENEKETAPANPLKEKEKEKERTHHNPSTEINFSSSRTHASAQDACTRTDAHTDTQTRTRKGKTTAFVIQSPPTLDEVITYCAERHNTIDPYKWHAHYTANGWKVGRNPMKDWRAAVRTWERQQIENPEYQSKPSQIEQNTLNHGNTYQPIPANAGDHQRVPTTQDAVFDLE